MSVFVCLRTHTPAWSLDDGFLQTLSLSILFVRSSTNTSSSNIAHPHERTKMAQGRNQGVGLGPESALIHAEVFLLIMRMLVLLEHLLDFLHPAGSAAIV